MPRGRIIDKVSAVWMLRYNFEMPYQGRMVLFAANVYFMDIV